MTAGVAGHRRVGIDSNVLIYLIDDAGALGRIAGRLLDTVADGQAQGILSSLVVAEVCSGPALSGDPALVERVADDLLTLDNTRFVGVSVEIAIDAAMLPGAGSLGLADAIHLASARTAGATAFITNDRRIKSVPQLKVLYLDELDVKDAATGSP